MFKLGLIVGILIAIIATAAYFIIYHRAKKDKQ